MKHEIQIRAVRPFFLEGRAVAVGTVVKASPLDACEVVGARRAEYVDPADWELVKEAIRAAAAKAAGNGNRGAGWVKNF
jgi:hypothetical protein